MPNERQNERYNTIPISVLSVFSSDEAVDLYEAQDGQFCFWKIRKRPPQKPTRSRSEEDSILASSRRSFEEIFSNIVSGDGRLFKDAIISFVHITRSL